MITNFYDKLYNFEINYFCIIILIRKIIYYLNYQYKKLSFLNQSSFLFPNIMC